MSEVATRPTRPPDMMCSVVFLDALRVKMHEDSLMRSEAVYLALGALPDGPRDMLDSE